MHYSNIDEYFEGLEAKKKLLQGSNLPLEGNLIVDKILLTNSERDRKIPSYLQTEKVDNMYVSQGGIEGTRHFGTTRPSSTRERHVYPKGTKVEGDRHIFAGTDDMVNRISEKLGAEISPELLGWNMVLKREDGEDFYLDGLPMGTDFMIYPEDVKDIRDKTKLLVNLKLSYFQKGCGITGKNIANHFNNPELQLNFSKVSDDFRGALLKVHGPHDKNISLESGQKVFVRIPTGKVI